MSTETEAPAGSALIGPVMPAAWMLRSLHDVNQRPWPTQIDSDAYRLASKRDDYECKPLYDQPALNAALSAERERCAKVCEGIESGYWRQYKDGRYSSHVEGMSDGAGECAAAIRALG